MTTIQRWDPFLRQFVSLRDAVDRLFEESVVNPDRLFSWTTAGARTMPLEIHETPDDIVVRALVPGVSPEALDVQYQQGVLTLRARTETPSAHDDWIWHLREFGYGEMTRTVSLPREIDVDQAQATFEHGVLTLRLPKAAEAKPRTIRVESPSRIGAGSGASA
ncbi:MAG TPA: Hsp20/alpha crystallin family protein [Candidatus Limnocylindrales bacterium]|nr:Hsp20/alpha crystallin family protein [Candidatus Limnocylindrales bacterium]